MGKKLTEKFINYIIQTVLLKVYLIRIRIRINRFRKWDPDPHEIVLDQPHGP